MRYKPFVLFVSALLLPGLLLLCPLRVAAETLSTETVLLSEESAAVRDQMLAYLSRTDVQQQLELQGVSLTEARTRVASLTDEEAKQIAPYLKNAPVAGDGVGAVIGAIVIIFLVLLVTDILGLTKVFPFTRSIRR